LKKKIKNISFKRGKYIIKIFQISGSPVIKLEGTPSIFFAYKEKKQRVWNQYMNISQHVKDFLNNLRITMKD